MDGNISLKSVGTFFSSLSIDVVTVQTDADVSSQSGGYDVEQFVDTPDYDLICTICQGVLRCPVRAACHHVFCKKCILQWLKRYNQTWSTAKRFEAIIESLLFVLVRQETCPCCRKPINACMIFVMFKLSKSIGRMKIKVGLIKRLYALHHILAVVHS